MPRSRKTSSRVRNWIFRRVPLGCVSCVGLSPSALGHPSNSLGVAPWPVNDLLPVEPVQATHVSPTGSNGAGPDPFDLTGDEGPRWEREERLPHRWTRSDRCMRRRRSPPCVTRSCATTATPNRWRTWRVALRPLLTPMILRRPHTLNPDQQNQQPRLATKTVMVWRPPWGFERPEDLFLPISENRDGRLTDPWSTRFVRRRWRDCWHHALWGCRLLVQRRMWISVTCTCTRSR